MKTLILGAGNLLLSDEGFGVHFIRHLQEHYTLPPEVELFDAGTLGLMAGHKLEEADRVYIVDVIAAPGEPGACVRYSKEDFLLKRIPLKLSPHQIGVQEMLLVSSLRGRCPEARRPWPRTPRETTSSSGPAKPPPAGTSMRGDSMRSATPNRN